MDKMSIINILMVGVPEVGLGFLMMLLIFKDNSRKQNNNTMYMIKLLLSVIIAIVLIRLNREYTKNITNLALISTFIYSFVFKVVWSFNVRKSILSGCLIMFVLILSENVTTFPANQLILQKMGNYNFLDTRIIWSLPTRIIQVVIIWLVKRFKFSLKNHILLNFKWRQLSNSEKSTSILLIFLMVLSIYFNSNYGEVFMKLKLNNIDIKVFNLNLIIIFIQTVIYIGLTIILLSRTSGYENYKHMIHSSKRTMIDILIEQSSDDDLLTLVDVVNKAIEGRCLYEEV